MASTVSPSVDVTYQPVLDVARGVAAGFEAVCLVEPAGTVAQRRRDARQAIEDGSAQQPHDDPTGLRTAAIAAAALGKFDSLPPNTFLSIPIDVHAAITNPVREVLFGRGSLSGIVLDLVGTPSAVPGTELERMIEAYRAIGALIAVGGHGAPQPELSSIVRFSPSIIRLGRDWTRGMDTSTAKRTAIEVIGQLAGQLDAWILAEGISSAAELRALAGLGVPLAQGPFVGAPRSFWPEIALNARAALPAALPGSDGVLRELVQQAYVTTDVTAAAAVLPETSGFEVVIVLDNHRRPVGLLEQDSASSWVSTDVLAINIDTPVADAVQRAMARPRTVRFTPLVCTDELGHFVGILRIERLMGHLAATQH